MTDECRVPSCGGTVLTGDKYCRACGADQTVQAAHTESDVSPKGEVEAAVLPREEAGNGSSSGRGTTVTITVPQFVWSPDKWPAAGGAVALLGCLLPLASGGQESITVLTIAEKVNSWLWLEPISAVALILLGARLSHIPKGLIPASLLALASAWLGVNLLFLVTLSTLISALGVFAGGGSVGIGLIFSIAGFGIAVGALIKMFGNVSTREHRI